MTWSKCPMSVVIVSGPATSVKSPTTRSRTAGIAKNVEYASADASSVPWLLENALTAPTKMPLQSRERKVDGFADRRTATPRPSRRLVAAQA